MYQLSANGHKHRQNAGKTHIFLEMRAAVCYSRDTDIYSQNTSLTNSFYHKAVLRCAGCFAAIEIYRNASLCAISFAVSSHLTDFFGIQQNGKRTVI